MRLIFVLIIGTLCMLGTMIFCNKWYNFSKKELILIAPILTATGFVSVKIMFYVENGKWDGLSFFGAVLLIPLWFLLISYVIKLPYAELVDICAPSICIMLALMKIECVISGCCRGKVLYETTMGKVRFPSQIVELVNALVIMVILIRVMNIGKQKGEIYAWFMILYGITRFIWNLFRETKGFIGLLPAGNFWAIISVFIGIFYIFMERKRKYKDEL